MRYQYKREPLTDDEANRLANECRSIEERLVVWTLLDTGLRLGELAGLTRRNLDGYRHRLTVYGKGGPSGPVSRRRVIPLSIRTRIIVELYFENHAALPMSRRTIHRIIRRVAGRAAITRPVSAHVLRQNAEWRIMLSRGTVWADALQIRP
jgi:integrase/recombinase XerD